MSQRVTTNILQERCISLHAHERVWVCFPITSHTSINLTSKSTSLVHEWSDFASLERLVDFISFLCEPPIHAYDSFTLGMFTFLLVIHKYSLCMKALTVLSAIYVANQFNLSWPGTTLKGQTGLLLLPARAQWMFLSWRVFAAFYWCL